MKHCEICSLDIDEEAPYVEGSLTISWPAPRLLSCAHASCLLSLLQSIEHEHNRSQDAEPASP